MVVIGQREEVIFDMILNAAAKDRFVDVEFGCWLANI
jgi:hypothetical protein